jgi:protein-disulfide isomerase
MPDASSRFTTGLLAVAVGCAVVVTGLVVKREITSPDTPTIELAPPIENWQALSSRGPGIRGQSPILQVVEFGDFQCPICRTFALSAMAGVLREHRDEVEFVYRHFPLPYHSFARPTANAAECADRQGRFQGIYEAFFSAQDSIGVLPIEEFARRAGIPDSLAFSKCMMDPAIAEIVEQDRLEALRVGATGTPTLFLNGRRLAGATDSVTFDKLVKVALREME